MDIFTELAALRPLVAYFLLFCFFMGLTLVSSPAIRRFTDYQMRRRHNDIAGFFFGVVGESMGFCWHLSRLPFGRNTTLPLKM